MIPKKIESVIKVLGYLVKEKQERIDLISKKEEQTEKEKLFIEQERQLIKNVTILVEEYKKDIRVSLGLIPPHCRELEEAVIGACLLEKFMFPAIVAYMKKEHFEDERLQLIFVAMKNLFDGQKRIDMRTVVVELRRMGQWKDANASYYVADIASKVSSSANIEYHARIVMEYAMRRAMIYTASRVLHRLYDEANDVFELLDEWKDTTKKIESWIDKPQTV